MKISNGKKVWSVICHNSREEGMFHVIHTYLKAPSLCGRFEECGAVLQKEASNGLVIPTTCTTM